MTPPQLGMDILEKSIVELQAAMDAGQLSSRDLVARYLARIRAYDQAGPALNAMITRNPNALAEAEALDRERAEKGPRGPLHGIPLVIKDNFDIAGMPTTGGSLALATFHPPDDAFQIRRLKEAGAVILGKTNMHELARGITSISSLGGQTRNPYDPRRNPGGSSGGTGAAVAANFAVAGFGSDTCGSIRVPSSHNSLVGLRATHGLASRDGIMPLAHSRDVGGPLARSTMDLAILLDVTVAPDSADPATRESLIRLAGRFGDDLSRATLKGARIGVLGAFLGTSGDEKPVGAVVREAVEKMRELGAEVTEVEIPGLDDLLRWSDVRAVIDYEYKTDLSAYWRTGSTAIRSIEDLHGSGLHHEILVPTLRRTARPQPVTDQAYRETQERREALRRAILALLDGQKLDAIAYPTIRAKANYVGERQSGSNCHLSGLSGFPALTVPAGSTRDGLPVGVELLGRPYSDRQLLGLGHAFERATRHRQPPDTTPALFAGAAPVPMAFTASASSDAGSLTVRFELDVTTSQLRYQVDTTGLAASDVLFVGLQRGGPGATGPVAHRLLRGARAGAGVLTLTGADRQDLREGTLYVNLCTPDRPTGALRAQLVLPSP